MREPWGPNLAPIGAVGAVGDQIDAELALGRLDRRIDFTCRHPVALSVELEVVDDGFHGALHLAALGRYNLAVGSGDRPLPFRFIQLADALQHDGRRLSHLLHPHQVAIVAVAVLADWNVKIHLVVALVWLRLAQVPGTAGAADHYPRESPSPAVIEGDDADIGVPLLEDAVAGEQAVDVVDDFGKLVTEAFDIIDQLLRQVLVDAAWSEIGSVHAGAGGALIEHHQLLALFEPPERRCQRAD